MCHGAKLRCRWWIADQDRAAIGLIVTPEPWDSLARRQDLWHRGSRAGSRQWHCPTAVGRFGRRKKQQFEK